MGKTVIRLSWTGSKTLWPIPFPYTLIMTEKMSEDELDFMTSFSTTSMSIPNSPVHGNQGVGLSNPQLSQGRRRMLDLVNRLHSTGCSILSLP